MLTRDQLKELFEYKDGHLYWLVNRGYHKVKGKLAGTKESRGYWQISIGRGHVYKAHRLIYLLLTGDNPKTLDHINGDRLDNRIENLRPSTDSQNQWNKRIHKNNKTGVPGVFKKRNSYWAYVGLNNKRITLGYYKTIEEAAKVVSEARINYHKEFAKVVSNGDN